jgi:hypothetical protein
MKAMMKNRVSQTSRRVVVAGVLGLVVVGVSFASAASLGSTTGSLGSGTQTIASCDPDGIDVVFSVDYSLMMQRYEVGDVTFKGVSTACMGHKLEFSVLDADGNQLGTAQTDLSSAPPGFDSHDVSLGISPMVDPEAIAGSALVIVK